MKGFAFGAIIFALFLVFIAVCNKRTIKNKIFVCPNCKRRFVPIRRKNVYFGNMANDSALLKCKYCGKLGICNQSHDQTKIEE